MSGLGCCGVDSGIADVGDGVAEEGAHRDGDRRAGRRVGQRQAVLVEDRLHVRGGREVVMLLEAGEGFVVEVEGRAVAGWRDS